MGGWKFNKILCTIILLFIVADSWAQCPANIGFENGTFQNWELSEGFVSKTDGSIFNNVVTSSKRITILQNSYPQVLDQYGQFPVNCPNGSNYSIMLGNNSTGGHAQTVSYTFAIPAGQDNYSIIYNYAVVLQNPSHQSWQQPGFYSKVFDVTSNQYIDCGAFNFVASSDLPGFQLSKIGSQIYYKPWSPITVKLVGYAGKTIRLEFTSHDCAPSGHFGYAYLDVNQNCSSPVSGNVYCSGSNSQTLTAPFGFSSYAWYNSDYSKVLGTSNVLKLSPLPTPGTLFHVVVSPYPGLGCLDTLHTTIELSPLAFNLQTMDSIVGCSPNLVDLTAPYVTAGSSSDLTFSYFIDTSQINYVPTPKQISSAGTYYIKAVNSDGCSDIKPVTVSFGIAPNLVVSDSLFACSPDKIDLTNLFITSGSDAGLKYSYWQDTATTISLTNPTLIDSSGTYFIKANNSGICFMVKPVHVIVSKNPVLTTIDQNACGSVNINSTNAFSSDQNNITTTFWQDSAANIMVVSPDSIKFSGTYYIKATNIAGCSSIAAIKVNVFPVPNLAVNDPPFACLPNKIDLTNALITAGSDAGLIYSYWKDAAATISLTTPQLIDVSGTYFIKANNSGICFTIKPVNAIVSTNPVLTIHDQTACGSANITSPIGFTSNQTDAKISFWQDAAATINIVSPDSIKLSGTYYMKAINPVGCSSIAAIRVNIFPVPYFTISQAPIVYLPTTIDLTALVKSTTNIVSYFSYWQDSAATISVIDPTAIYSSGEYYIKSSTSNLCFVLDSVKLIVNEPLIIPPNAFSPNNDGINDTWDIPLLRFYPQCTVDIFNRYGQNVFHSFGYNKSWDGKITGQDLSYGTYYYIIKLKQSRAPISGSVTIIR